ITTSSESFEQSFPAAAFSSCKITHFSPARVCGTNNCKFSNPGICTWKTNTFEFLIKKHNVYNTQSCTGADTMNSALTFLSILAKPSALEALSLQFDLISSEAVLSSALVQNSAQLSCRPQSKNPPVDFSSIPAIKSYQNNFPACASPPLM
uniref:Uncharacterized protein n=1 Tax=Sarcophilus harrisii TaxID=9305 RepID=A0A7N4NTN3_SARHA